MEITGWKWGIDIVLSMFPARAHANIVRYFHHVESALAKFGITDQDLRLVAYATIRAETANFAPVLEGESRFNTLKIPLELTRYGEEHKYNLYELRNKTTFVLGRKVSGLGNEQMGDGKKFMGRGFVQLTGRANYLKYGQKIGLGSQLLEAPEKANDPIVAAELLAAYIQDHRHRISKAVKRGDLRSARSAVNGGLNGWAEFEQAYQIGFNLMRTDAKDLPNTRSTA